MHSWRVLLLPYLGQEGLYHKYDFSQSWDSPTNLALVTMMPAVYANPSDDSSRPFGETNYMVVVGKNSVFREDGCTTNLEIRDGMSETILVVESNIGSVRWLQPTDLNVKKMDFSINGSGNAIGGCQPDGANVLMADGNTRFLRNDTSPDYVEAMITRNGDELIPFDEIE